MDGSDVYLNLVGGAKVTEPAFDAAIISALLSSTYNLPIPDDVMVVGEVGLSGEIRNVNQIESRIKEAKKLGYTTCIIPLAATKSIKDENIVGVKNVNELFRYLRKIIESKQK